MNAKNLRLTKLKFLSAFENIERVLVIMIENNVFGVTLTLIRREMVG